MAFYLYKRPILSMYYAITGIKSSSMGIFTLSFIFLAIFFKLWTVQIRENSPLAFLNPLKLNLLKPL